MAQIPTQNITVDGTPPTFASAAVGDTAQIGDKVFIIVKNSGAASTVTVAVPGTLVNNVAAPDTTVTLTSGTGEVWIPLDTYYGDPSVGGKAQISYGTTTGVTRAVIKR